MVADNVLISRGHELANTLYKTFYKAAFVPLLSVPASECCDPLMISNNHVNRLIINLLETLKGTRPKLSQS